MARPPRPPGDPHQLDPLFTTLPTGARLFRVHPQHVGATAFNPGQGKGGRFHFIRSANGLLVPSFYAAEDAFAALAETVFHDVPVRSSRFGQLAGALTGDRELLVRSVRGVSFRRQLAGRLLSELRTERDLSLVQLHDLGLKRLRLTAGEISATDPSRYPQTRSWAKALHEACPAAGLVWMSRLFDSRRAFALFGDRASEKDFHLVSAPLELWHGPGLQLVYEIARTADVAVFHAW